MPTPPRAVLLSDLFFPSILFHALVRSAVPALRQRPPTMSYPYSTHHSSKGASSSAAALTSANRTYDAKLVQREMLRLGTALGALSSSTAAVLTSGGPLTLPAAVTGASGASGSSHGHAHALGHALVHGHGGNAGIASGTDGGAWTQLHVYVLPLFNHEQLQYPMCVFLYLLKTWVH